MSKVKNISGGELGVPFLGRMVEDGETIEVPDRQDGGDPEDPAMAIIWPGNRWEPVTDKAAKAAAKADTAAADDTSGKAAE